MPESHAGGSRLLSRDMSQGRCDSGASRFILHVDLAVDPAKEQEMLKNFRTIFRPAAANSPDIIDVKMLKLRTAVQGEAPAGRITASC